MPTPKNDTPPRYTDAERAEAALRWRLVLGRFADNGLPLPGPNQRAESGSGDLSELLERAGDLDQALEVVYDRAFAQRAHRQAGPGSGTGLVVPAWLKGVRELFPQEAVRVIERDALVRYGLTELVTDAEVLREATPTPDLLKAILQFKHLMQGDVLEAAREIVRQVVEELAESLHADCAPALYGSVNRRDARLSRTFRNTDWSRTIHRNLRNWDAERQRLVADRITYKHRQRGRSPWRIVVAVDQSGSMLDSLIHAAIMAAILASLPAVTVHLVLFDHRVVDVSEHAADPLEVLMGAQLGGGTQLLPAMEYCAALVTEPERTLMVIVSDFFLFSEGPACLALAAELDAAGITGFGLCALDTDTRPVYDERFARDLASVGWTVGALTPRKLAEVVAKRLG